MSEGDIVKSIMAALTLNPRVWAMRVNSGTFVVSGRYIKGAPAGTPDIVGSCSGRMFGIEVKTAKGRLSPAQKTWAKMAEKMGIKCGVARSAGEALALLREWFE